MFQCVYSLDFPTSFSFCLSSARLVKLTPRQLRLQTSVAKALSREFARRPKTRASDASVARDSLLGTVCARARAWNLGRPFGRVELHSTQPVPFHLRFQCISAVKHHQPTCRRTLDSANYLRIVCFLGVTACLGKQTFASGMQPFALGRRAFASGKQHCKGSATAADP